MHLKLDLSCARVAEIGATLGKGRIKSKTYFRAQVTIFHSLKLKKGETEMDIPRIFSITESSHRIHNPFTPEKFATLGSALRLKPGARVLDLGCGSGEMLCTWARDHGISGIGIDLCQLFIGQAKLRAAELGVSNEVEFIHADAAGFVVDKKVDVASKRN